jgi:adenosylhomocysteine nucleosidase
VTATRIEFHAVARALRFPHPVSHYGHRALASNDHGLNILLIQSGIGPDKARKSAQQLLAAASWDVMISTGFAGALDTGPIGTVLIGEEVFREPCTTSHIPLTPQRIVCHPDWVQSALSLTWMGQEPLRTGRFVSVNRVLTHSVDKYKLKASTGAVGVDMESAAIGEVAQGHGLSFLIVRAISDGVNEDLPVDFNLFLKPFGWFSGVMHIMTTPRSWKGFLDLYRHSKQASLQLTRFFEEFFSAVSTMPPSPTPLTMKS